MVDRATPFRLILLAGLFCAFAPASSAEDLFIEPAPDEEAILEAQEPLPRTFWESKLIFGLGLKDIKVGETTEGNDVRISGGGGLGGRVGFGYRFNDKLEALLSAGMQVSTLTPRLNNASASFRRKFFLLTGRYKVRFGTGAIRPGVGLGLYQGPRLRLNLGQVGDFDYDIRYDDAVGLHAGFDFEAPFGRRAFTLGVAYTTVVYEAGSLTINGLPASPQTLDGDFHEFNGDSLDFSVGLKF